jgi:hypothetical protein
MRSGGTCGSDGGRPASLPRRLLLFLHQFPQRSIDPRLVTAPRLLEPGQHIGVQTQRDRLLQWLVPRLYLWKRKIAPLRLLSHRPKADRFPAGCLLGLLNSCSSFHLDAIIHTQLSACDCMHKCSNWNIRANCSCVPTGTYLEGVGLQSGMARASRPCKFGNQARLAAPPRIVTPASPL